MENHPRVLTGLPYTVPADVLLKAVSAKIRALKAKVAARDARLAKIRAEHALKDSDLVLLLQEQARERRQMLVQTSIEIPGPRGKGTRHIPAGVLAELSAESSARSDELSAIAHLGTVRAAMRVSELGNQRVSISLSEFVYLDIKAEPAAD